MKFRWETEFKETEIGEIPKDWEMSKIGVFYKLKYGITANSGEFGNCRLLRQTDLNEGFIDISSVPYSEVSEDEIQKYLLKDDDLVISRIANVGSIGYVSFEALNSLDKPLIFGSYLLKFEKIKEIHNKFTFYFLLSPQIQDYIKSIADGSTRQNTNAKVVAEFPLYVPPLPEQSRIATVLSYFDDLIEVKKRQNEILEKSAMAIFKSWFVDFEPFRACPEQERGNCEFVYNEELGREIPKGWTVKKWGDVVNFFDNQRIPLSEVERLERKGQYPYYGANGIIDYINDYIFNGKYLLVAEDGTVMDKNGFAIINIVEGKFWANNHVHIIQGKDIPIDYLYLHLKHYPIEPYTTGAVQPKLSQENFSKMPILLPPPSILQSFHSLVEPLFQKIILNQKQIMTLRKIRDTLLPLLVFGKLRIEEV
jgi:type I restriction enzyme S subunit